MKIGLTLGKFAPLHIGHQFLFETALKEVDKLIVIVYESKEITNIPLNIRAGWIRQLYPDIEVIEGWGGPSAVGNTEEIKRLQENYVQGLLGKQKITHFYSSEFYGDHMSKALGAINRLIDESRKSIPISSTLIRQDPFATKQYISPIVYKDLITTVVFLGAPSSGKTTIAKTMAQVCKTKWMPEYGREYWEKHHVNRRLTKDQLTEIAIGHIEREDSLIQESNKYLFVDTNAITTYMFSLYYHDSATPSLISFAQRAETRYDIVFVCDIDIPYDDTWDRSGDVNRISFHNAIIEDLNERNVAYSLLSGSLEERIDKVITTLNSYRKT